MINGAFDVRGAADGARQGDESVILIGRESRAPCSKTCVALSALFGVSGDGVCAVARLTELGCAEVSVLTTRRTQNWRQRARREPFSLGLESFSLEVRKRIVGGRGENHRRLSCSAMEDVKNAWKSMAQ